MVIDAGVDPAASRMSNERSPAELIDREWYALPGSSRVMPVCKTGAFPSGARRVNLIGKPSALLAGDGRFEPLARAGSPTSASQSRSADARLSWLPKWYPRRDSNTHMDLF